MTRERLPRRRPEQLTDEQRRLHEAIAGGPRSSGPFPLTDADGVLVGPFDAMLLSPDVGARLADLGAAVRYGSGLPDRLREMAILLVAHHWSSVFETWAHTLVGRSVGLTDDELTAVRQGRTPEGLHDEESAALSVVRALLDDADLDDDGYASAVQQLGERALFDLTTLVGYYATLALQLRVFRADGTPPG